MLVAFSHRVGPHGTIRSRIWHIRAQMGPYRPIWAQYGPNVVPCKPTWHQYGPRSAHVAVGLQFGLIRIHLGSIWAHVGQKSKELQSRIRGIPLWAHWPYVNPCMQRRSCKEKSSEGKVSIRSPRAFVLKCSEKGVGACDCMLYAVDA